MRTPTCTPPVNRFDLLSELSAKTLPDGTLTESRTYDTTGNLASVTHFNGVTTTYTYDSLTARSAAPRPGETTVSFTYTATGKYATTTDASGTTTYGYDTMDRLITKATPEGTLNYTYDAAGHVASITSSNTNGASMSYTYDSLNRLSTVVDNRLSGIEHDHLHLRPGQQRGAPRRIPTAFKRPSPTTRLNRVTGLATQASGYTYQRGPTGNLTNATESNGRTVNWSYDGIYRLTNESIAGDPEQQQRQCQLWA